MYTHTHQHTHPPTVKDIGLVELGGTSRLRQDAITLVTEHGRVRVHVAEPRRQPAVRVLNHWRLRRRVSLWACPHVMFARARARTRTHTAHTHTHTHALSLSYALVHAPGSRVGR